MGENTKSIVRVTSDELVTYTNKFIKGKSGDLALPKNYDAVGAVKSFYLAVLEAKDKKGRPALEVCTKTSIFKSALELVTKGLDVRKKQAYPIVYGNQLNLQVSYFGNQKLARTFNPNVQDFSAQVILKGDDYETEIGADGRKKLIRHKQKFGTERSIENILGAYSVVQIGVDADGTRLYDLEDMTTSQIKQSWAKSRSSGEVHKEFPEEMAKKTVLSRHAKRLINSTDDFAVLDTTESIISNEAISIDEPVIEVNIMMEEDSSSFEPEEQPLNAEYQEEEMPEVEDFDGDEVLTITYKEWVEKYKASGEWEQIHDSYDRETKTIQIKKTKNA